MARQATMSGLRPVLTCASLVVRQYAGVMSAAGAICAAWAVHIGEFDPASSTLDSE